MKLFRGGAATKLSLAEKPASAEGGGCIVNPGKQHQAAGAFDQHADGKGIVRTLDEVTFPVARHHAVIHLGQAYVDAHHVGNLSAPVGAPASRHAIGAMVAQTGDAAFCTGVRRSP